jgi:hypothetical protein
MCDVLYHQIPGSSLMFNRYRTNLKLSFMKKHLDL